MCSRRSCPNLRGRGRSSQEETVSKLRPEVGGGDSRKRKQHLQPEYYGLNGNWFARSSGTGDRRENAVCEVGQEQSRNWMFTEGQKEVLGGLEQE